MLHVTSNLMALKSIHYYLLLLAIKKNWGQYLSIKEGMLKRIARNLPTKKIIIGKCRDKINICKRPKIWHFQKNGEIMELLHICYKYHHFWRNVTIFCRYGNANVPDLYSKYIGQPSNARISKVNLLECWYFQHPK